MRKFKNLEEVRKLAREGGERFRAIFGIPDDVVITKEIQDEGERLLDVVERDEGEPLIFNDKDNS
jgi:hypothetical protein